MTHEENKNMETPDNKALFTLTAEEVLPLKGLLKGLRRFYFEEEDLSPIPLDADEHEIIDFINHLLTRIKKWQQHNNTQL